MGRLQSIQNALNEINPTVFQELCDCYLVLKNSQYKALLRVGSQSGKQKTISGTPDASLLLNDDKYLFIEYTTIASQRMDKLKVSIDKCLNPEITGVALEKIKEIILCNNFNLEANEIEQLEALVTNTSICLKVIMLDELAIELHLKYPHLAHQYLGLALDSGQIVSTAQFITEYNKASQGIATGLDNILKHRNQEKLEIKELILKTDLLIVSGAAGVGKTKLIIEILNEFTIEQPSYTAYCISYKDHDLLNDLNQYLDKEKNYILFVDDANRNEHIKQILGAYSSQRNGMLKIILTVRDYAVEDVQKSCYGYLPELFYLKKMSDEEITDIIQDAPFNIVDYRFHEKILDIADGNPRLAIMAAQLAIQTNDLYSLYNASDLFEKYFLTFIHDGHELSNNITIKALGLLSFFNTLPYKNNKIIGPILNDFGIEYHAFFDVVAKLEKLELVDVQFDYVKISEQNLAIYLFYKAFIKDELLSMDTLLNGYLDKNTARFKECVIAANNTYGYNNVMLKLRPKLKSCFDTITSSEQKTLDFLSTFWLYLPNETLDFIYKKIEELLNPINSIYIVKFEKNSFTYNKNKILGLLRHYFDSPHQLKDFLELAFEYVRKTPENLPELVYIIRETLIFDSQDPEFNFQRQVILFDLIITGLNYDDPLYTAIFFEIAKDFLSTWYQHTKTGRNNTIQYSEYVIQNSEFIQTFRRNIWDALDKNFQNNQEMAFNLLETYPKLSPNRDTTDIIKGELLLFLNVIERHLTSTSFIHCQFIHDKIKLLERHEIIGPTFQTLKLKFTNYTYELYNKIFFNFDDAILENQDYYVYLKHKENSIRAEFNFTSLNEIRKFYEHYLIIYDSVQNIRTNDALDIIIEKTFNNSPNLGYEFLKLILEDGNIIEYAPNKVFPKLSKNKSNRSKTWTLILNNNFKLKLKWSLAMLYVININDFKKIYLKHVLTLIEESNDQLTINLGKLVKLISISPNLISNIIEAVFNRNLIAKNHIAIDFTHLEPKYFEHQLELVKKSYIQQYKFNSTFDYDKNLFITILKLDSQFLFEFITQFQYSNYYVQRSNGAVLSCIWQVVNIAIQLEGIFNYFAEKHLYVGITEHFCNIFFRPLEKEYINLADEFLFNYVNLHYNNLNKINIIIDITRHSRREIFGKILLHYLSLTQEVNLFAKIQWLENGGIHIDGSIHGEIQAQKWRDVLNIINEANLGFKILPIKIYIQKEIENQLAYANFEREQKFIRK